MNIRTRRITSLIVAGGILAGGGLGLSASSALAHDNGGMQQGPRAERGGHHGMPAAVKTAVKQLLNVDDAALKSAKQAGTSLTALAKQKGVDRAELVSTISQALKTGKPANAPALTDAQLTAMAGRIADHVPGERGHRGERGERGDATRTAVEAAIAKSIGVSADQLKAARKAGTSPATLAEQKGVARATVIDATVAALKANKPAGAPTLTDAQLTAMAERIVDNARPGHGPGGHHGPGGRGGHRR